MCLSKSNISNEISRTDFVAGSRYAPRMRASLGLLYLFFSLPAFSQNQEPLRIVDQELIQQELQRAGQELQLVEKTESRQVLKQNEESPRSCSFDQQEPELQALLSLHNHFRDQGLRCGRGRKKRAQTLLWNCELTVASRVHAEDMQAGEFLGHQGSNGSSMGERARRAGYQWLNVSENVAKGHKSAELVFQSWVKSKGHCKNIANDAYQEFGAAKVGDYWVVMLGSQ